MRERDGKKLIFYLLLFLGDFLFGEPRGHQLPPAPAFLLPPRHPRLGRSRGWGRGPLTDATDAEYAQLLLRLLYCYNNLPQWNVGGVDVLEAKVGISDKIKRTFPTLNDNDDEKIKNEVHTYASEIQRYHEAEKDFSWSCANYARPGPAGRPD